MSYTPFNVDVFVAAFSGAMTGMAVSGRVITSSIKANYVVSANQAGAFAQEFDTVWQVTAENTVTELTIIEIFQMSQGYWDRRDPPPSQAKFQIPSTYEQACTAIIAAVITSAEYFNREGITPPNWNSGGGGGGGVPDVTGIGYVLTGTGIGPAATNSDWEIPGGPAINSFSKTHGSLFEVGASDVSPQFTASYNETPTSASIIYTGASGSPLVLSTPFTSGTIAQTFTSSTNGATDTFTLSAHFGATVKTATLTDTWALPFLSDIAPTGSVVATQGFLDAMRAADTVQLHTANGGTYLANQNVAAGNISAIATPTALGTPTFKDKNGLIVSPVVVGTIPGYVNPFSVNVPMTLYTVGGVGIGTVTWSLS